MIARHTHFQDFCFRSFLHQKIMNQFVAFLSVKIIRIDYGKGTIDHISGLHKSMCSPPRLVSSLRKTIALRQSINLLKGIMNIGNLLNPFSDNIPEFLLNILSNHKNQLIKTCSQSIMNGIVHNNFPEGTDFRQLFYTRSIT